MMKIESRKLIKNIIYILMGLQILLGVFWIGCNFMECPRFEESKELLTMSETLLVDEYTGILYPVLLKGVVILETWTGFFYGAFLYMIQLIVAMGAYVYLLRCVVNGKKWWEYCYYAGFLITVPTVVQCHMAVLPYSLASSVFCICIGEGMLLWRKEQIMSGKALISLGSAWIISGMLCLSYLWIGGFLLVMCLLRNILLHKEKFWKLGVLLLVGTCCIQGINGAFQTPGCTGKIQKSIGATMVTRFVWPNFTNFYYFWDEEIKNVLDFNSLVGIATYPESVIYDFGPKLEKAYGRKEADRIYWEMTGLAISLDTKRIVFRLGKDALAYVCPPLTMLIQLEGIDVSYTGWNYGRMKDYAPQLTYYYVEYALSAWLTILGLELLLVLLSLKKKAKDRMQEGIGIYIGGLLLFVDLWFVICNGHMQDYKALMVNSILCGVLLVFFASRTHVDK